ncbi:hypothetical protein [Neobacillus niacini]|uniref:hypothetical protein n=1 Tax=Neobacillus niacini TaxID=86668 RepID=UPI0020411BA1|nr:hypothetical protein [Neobacillus niacini]MCM3690125.1 hypothetical protein [Neobacillus niacini]
MPDKKESNPKISETPKTTKRRRNSVDNPKVENEVIENEGTEPILESKEQEPILVEEDQYSSLDLLWNHAFRELDQWAKKADFRDDVFLKEAMYFAESIKRNQENIKSVREQFNKEFGNWERTAREEFLMSTTVLQHIFPKISYEDINQQIDQIQSRTASILNAPLQKVVNNQMMDQYLQMAEQYISLRKNARMQYIKTLKQAASLIYESQKGFVNLLTGQLKTVIFPLNKYMEPAEEVTKS